MLTASIKNTTKNSYISAFRQYWKYCNKYGYDPWYMYNNIQYWCHYLLWRVDNNSIYVLKKDRRGITYIFVDLFNYNTPFVGTYYALFIKKLNKIYGHECDSRLPLLLHHHIKFCKYFNFDRTKVFSIKFDILLIILLTQLYGFAGRRCGELINKNSPMLMDNISFKTSVIKNGKIIKCEYMTILHNEYKNKQYKQDFMLSIIGKTDYIYIDPYYYTKIYLLRRKSLNLKYSGNQELFMLKNGKNMTYSMLKTRIINIFKENIVEPESKPFITPYSLRIGLNVMLETRSLSSGQIRDYVGWSRGDRSSQIRYIRMPTYWKTGIISFILETQPNISGWNRWESHKKIRK